MMLRFVKLAKGTLSAGEIESRVTCEAGGLGGEEGVVGGCEA